jgi:hypothetical protein
MTTVMDCYQIEVEVDGQQCMLDILVSADTVRFPL